MTQTETVAWPKSIGAITLFVEDLVASKRFYENTFGLPVVFQDNNSIVFKMGGTLINLLKIESADELVAPAQVARRDAGSRNVFSIEVDDVDAMCIELVARGVTLLNGPVDRSWGIRTASFQDPAGHIWAIGK